MTTQEQIPSAQIDCNSCGLSVKTKVGPIRWKLTEINLGNILTIATAAILIAVGWGVITTRVSNAETQISGLNSAVRDTNTAIQTLSRETNLTIQNLAIVLTETKTQLRERTERAEFKQQADASANRREIRRAEAQQQLDASLNRDAIARKVERKPGK